MTHTRKIVCDNCKTEYVIPIGTNFMYFCPRCRECNGFECEYGFAAITPCDIYLGEKKIGQLLGGGGSFRLVCPAINISTPLAGGYKNCAVYEEAKEIIRERLREIKGECHI